MINKEPSSLPFREGRGVRSRSTLKGFDRGVRPRSRGEASGWSVGGSQKRLHSDASPLLRDPYRVLRDLTPRPSLKGRGLGALKVLAVAYRESFPSL